MNKKFFVGNRERLASVLPEDSMVVLFSGKAPKKSADEKYPFTTNRHFYYMCGIKEENIMLKIAKVNGELKSTIYIKKHNPEEAKWVGETISTQQAEHISGVDEVKYVEDFERALHYGITQENVETIYFDLERDHFTQEITTTQQFATSIQHKYPAIMIKDIYKEIAKLRSVKQTCEIEKLKHAIEITNKGIQQLMKHAQSGIKEYELEAHFDFVLKTNGIRDYAFKTIAASGVNATTLHYEENNCTIPENSLILFDLGAQYEYYNADISRTFPVSGQFTERQSVLYNIVLKAQLAVIEQIKPGVKPSELNDLVKKIYLEELKPLGLVETLEDVSKYYYHGVGHNLGLDTHDVGVRNAPLEAGMVLTVEPGLYIEEEEIGIRIEDNILVTEEGYENLSSQIIKTVKEIESFMAEYSK